MNDIEKTKAEIKVLETKLSFLEEIEKHNAKIKMNDERGHLECEMEKQDALDQLQQIQEKQEKRMEYYYDLIGNGEELTSIENSNAKKLFRKGYADSLEKGKAIARRNRDLQYDWNDWFYNRFDRTPDEEVETND